MKLKNVLKYGVAAAALSMVLLCAPAAYAEGPEAEVPRLTPLWLRNPRRMRTPSSPECT